VTKLSATQLFRSSGLALALALATAACSRPAARHYQLEGQILAIDRKNQAVTIRHEDIPGFMPGMTMSFKVADGKLLDGRVPGDLIRATLVINATEGQLVTVERVGEAPLAAAEPELPLSILQPGAPVADAALTDHRGVARQVSDLQGQVLAVTFTYTRCPVPTFCPAMDRQFQRAQEALRSDASLSGRTRLLSITLDPDYDTPAVLAAHARQLKADDEVWWFLTGPQNEIDVFAAQFGVSVIRDSPEDLVHNLRTAVIGRDGRLAATLNGGDWTTADLIAELRRAHAGR
jgi:protein SCO1